MRISTSLLSLAVVTLVAAPAFAQGQPASPLSQAGREVKASEEEKSPQINFGLGLSRGETERSLLPIAPITKDSVALSWKPTSNWDVTLDLTSRSQSTLPNQIFPREEVTAGVTYQVTPSFRLGGGVTVKGDSVAESLSNTASNFGKEGNEASVRIESAFSF